ncbi:hypothetical protein, unknown function [Leishmania infantum JPCM5]|uniref:Uncharacterized protein n=2 Tax=Leishmania infantum TaxID=5671 RepID=A4IBW2_LEIIN|nr:hypothetical protein, unknown function [Leishmania infantum JPCM5]CAC9546692.1 hypothetical_protein_-_conserved [Leishmania infantum]CAM72334.1 hypothetical protein, unknown function [Leishmania infantum JPCM5]SUZ46253.1 hypothetical_protein_-_conserved [Leishmania infantum]|eukprot:XP_001469231.1 hypothetical protein, unknown function [Leishmania infantum JPCM5]
MADFPEWNSGEIVEEDVGEYLDPRSALAAKVPPKMRRQGRLPPKKDTTLSASPKAIVDFVPMVECDVLDDEFADKGLGGMPLELCLDSRQLSKPSPPHHAVSQPKGLPTSANGSEAAPTQSASPPLTPSVPSCAASTAGVSAADRGSRPAAAPPRISSAVRTSSGTGRPNVAPQNTDSSRPPPSKLGSMSGVQSSKTKMPLPAGCPHGSKPSKPSKRVFRVSSSRASVSSADGSTTSECDSSIREAPPPLSAPAGMSLPTLQSKAARARTDALRKPFSAETPAPLQAKIPSHASLSSRASGVRGPPPMATDRAVPCGVAAPASSSRVANPDLSLKGPANGSYAVRGSRAAPSVAAPASTGPTRSTTAATIRTRATRSSSITRSTSLQRTVLNLKSEPEPSSGDYAYGGFFVCERAVEHQGKDSLAGTQVLTTASSAASSTDYSVLRGTYDSYAHGPGKTGPLIAAPHIGSSLASAMSELRDTTARLPALPAFSGQRPKAMLSALPQHPRPPRHSVSAGTMAPRTHSFSHQGPVSKFAMTGTKAPSVASALAEGSEGEGVKEEEANEMNVSSDFQNADKHRKCEPHKKREARRRGTDFDKI